MPPQSSRCSSSCHSTHSGYLTSSKSHICLLFCFPRIWPLGCFCLGFHSCLVCVERLTGSLGLGTESTGSCITTKRKGNNSNNTYGKVWGIHKIPKSTHLSHRLFPPMTDVPISLANSLHCWQASRVSCSRYWTCYLLVRGRRSIRFISLSEGGDESGKKVFIQFLHHCCSTAAT